MKIRIPLTSSLLLLAPVLGWAQTRPVEGLRQNDPGVHALVGGRVVVSPGRVLEGATLVIRNGLIEAVGTNVTAPADARVWDMRGRTLYAGFIDAFSDVGMPTARPDGGDRGAVYWNSQVRSFVDAASELVTADDDRRSALRAQGFTAALAVPQLGMFRGQAAAVSLGHGEATGRLLREGIAQTVSLTRDARAGGGYPTSSMGSVTLVRQVLLDADWYGRARAAYDRNPAGLRRPESNVALAALGAVSRGEQPLLFDTRSDEEFLRALAFAEEFPIQLWVRGSGFEYRIVDVLAGKRVPLILPVAYPAAPNVERPEESLNLSLSQLRHWQLAPENPARLAAAGIEFAFTSDGLQDRSRFLPNVRRAVERGLPPNTALAALTTVPARYLGLERTHGSLEAGKIANLVVVEGDIFANGSTVRDVWIDGVRFEISSTPTVDPRGQWLVAFSGERPMEGRLTLEGTPARLTGSFAVGEESTRLASARIRDEARRFQLAFPGTTLGYQGEIRLSGTLDGDQIFGWGEFPDGGLLNWYGTRVAGAPAPSAGNNAAGANGGSAESAARGSSLPPLELRDLRPAMEYGRERQPDQPQNILVRGATIWTQGPQGLIENGDLLIRQGRVVQVGRGLQPPPGALIIEANGKHVTPGLIDAHLHSGVSGGVNETGSAIVPEVRIGDVLTINNIAMYRQLAGGLTTAHVMHGSANPIGGQNQVVKLRWGALPDELKLDGAPRTVKFALGENVVRREERYPDTRMGVEQIIRDHFQAAREYEAVWQDWERGGRRGIPPRRDLRLEALRDILNGDILVMSHSYRQDEILMLIRLADEFGFRIQAFHHGVETYKVAPDLVRHGAAAAVWSDWSSFKIEAYDATTYNARVLRDAGVLVTLHSDDAQVASRMNWEAAKMLRTGFSEQEALALVTNNTAKVLGIDNRVGSLEPGKDGDFVIWSGHPLSSASVAEQTWIDGRKYFDLEEDTRLRQEIERERARLIQRVLEERTGN